MLTWTVFTMTEPQSQPNNPLHGVTLESMLYQLIAHYEWSGLARRIQINCFRKDPSINSSLKFLRKTPWARKKVEDLYLEMIRTGTRPGEEA